MAGSVTVHRDVVFSRPTGFRPVSLDLYVPDRPAYAVCVYLHGGGWRVGSRTLGPGRSAQWQPTFFEQVAQQGLAVASADYRLSGEAIFPAQREDVAAAVSFLSEHRSDYGIDTRATVGWGVSAGGHLAALHALTGPAGQRPFDAVACWYPTTDLLALPDDVDAAGGHGERGSESREHQLMGGPATALPDAYRAASPALAAIRRPAPFLLMHGSDDVLVPPRQSERLAQALVDAGGDVVLDIVPGATHMFPELDDVATQAAVTRTVEFLLGG